VDRRDSPRSAVPAGLFFSDRRLQQFYVLDGNFDDKPPSD
jgi:hypothetical protein